LLKKVVTIEKKVRKIVFSTFEKMITNDNKKWQKWQKYKIYNNFIIIIHNNILKLIFIFYIHIYKMITNDNFKVAKVAL